MNLSGEEQNQLPKQEWKLIPGLLYKAAFLASFEETALLQAIDQQSWLGDLSRKVQHYGYKYDYKARCIDLSMRLGGLPAWVEFVANRLVTEWVFASAPDQLIINEYFPGQGIAPHIDCEPCFTDTIASISLGAPTVMDYSKGTISIPVLLASRSLVLMKGESRHEWKHGIAGRKTDKINGEKILRERRVSLTFRQVIIQ